MPINYDKLLESRFPSPYRVVIPAFGGSQLVSLPANEEYEAVSIGPQSHVANCYIFADGAKLPQASTATGTDAVVNEIFQGEVIKLGVKSPFIGRIKGPITISTEFSKQAYNSLRANDLGSYPATLELYFHRKAPFWLPMSRPDDRFCQLDTDVTGTAAERSFLQAPGSGRTEQLFSARTVGTFTSGTITVNLYGIHLNGQSIGGGLTASNIATFDLTSSVTARSYEYEGKFDFYYMGFSTASVVGSSLSLYGSILVRD